LGNEFPNQPPCPLFFIKRYVEAGGQEGILKKNPALIKKVKNFNFLLDIFKQKKEKIVKNMTNISTYSTHLPPKRDEDLDRD
jgi:hypothetical protein